RTDISVLLLEAGPADAHPDIAIPARWTSLPGSAYDWIYDSEPEPGLDGRVVPLPRGKVVGGSSAINAMVYIRGHRADYDGWAALGNTGGGYEDVLPYFKKSEKNEVAQDAFHDTGGPLNVTSIRTINPILYYFLDVGRQFPLP